MAVPAWAASFPEFGTAHAAKEHELIILIFPGGWAHLLIVRHMEATWLIKRSTLQQAS